MDVAQTPQLFYDQSRGAAIVAWSTALIVLLVIGLHLRLDIYSGNSIVVPAFICLVAVAGLGLLNAATVTIKILPSIFAIWALAFLMAGIQAKGVDGLGEVLNPTLQFAASVFVAATLYLSLKQLAPSHIRRTVTMLWGAFVALAVLESIALRDVFDGISVWLYSGTPRVLYDQDLRDLQIYGSIRPKALASEPSFLTYTLSVLSLIRFVADDGSSRVRRIAVLVAMFTVNYLVSPSLSAAFFLIAAMVWWLWPSSPRRLLMLFTGAAMIAALMALLADGLITNPPAVLRSHMESGSFMGRILIGPPAALKVLSQHPLTGLGIGNDVGAYPIIAQEWSSNGGFARFPWYAGFDASDLMTNGFWWQWIYLGLGGGIVILTLVVRLLARIGVEKPFRAIFCAWIVWYAGAAFVAPYSWVLVGVFALSPGVLRWSASRGASLLQPAEGAAPARPAKA